MKVKLLVSNLPIPYKYRHFYILLHSVSLIYRGLNDFKINYKTDLLSLGYKAKYDYDNGFITLKGLPK
jgi:hypothetical protein